MAIAKLVRLEGIDAPCLLVVDDGKLPDEVVVDLSRLPALVGHERPDPVTFRLQPSSIGDPEPRYVEIFDE